MKRPPLDPYDDDILSVLRDALAWIEDEVYEGAAQGREPFVSGGGDVASRIRELLARATGVHAPASDANEAPVPDLMEALRHSVEVVKARQAARATREQVTT